MEPLVTAEEMHACDQLAIRQIGIPGVVLMENAGRAVATHIEAKFGNVRERAILVLCGKGNNGGDGFVAARHLLHHGAKVTVRLVGKKSQLKGDSKTNCDILARMVKQGGSESLSIDELQSARSLNSLGRPDIVIDALFGTGFSGPVKSPYKEMIEWINASGLPVVAVDMPSGLESDTGRIWNVAVRADLTVTMGLKKTGLVVGRGPEVAGEICVEHLGIPGVMFAGNDVRTFLVSPDDLRMILPKRPFDAHKHSVGKIFVLAGSPGLTGAAAMASMSAMRAGAGSVILGTPRSVYHILAKKLTEVMVDAVEETAEGTVARRALSQIEKHVGWADVVVLGPGLSRNAETQELVCNLVERLTKPLLIDADGLNALVENTSVLKKHENRHIILTPHTGELSRLVRVPSEEIENNRVETARSFAEKVRLTLVLKGAPTVTASQDGYAYVNSSGNPGMATAGSGDVLAGIIAALWAQKIRSHEAAYCGVYIHGLAGDIARDAHGERGMLATDVLAEVPSALRRIEREAK